MTDRKRRAFKQIAKDYGTPLYVYDEARIRAQCRAVREAFPGVSVHYAVKANANPALLSSIRAEGLGIEAVSIGELALAKKAKFTAHETSFTCASLSEQELLTVARFGARVHLDSLRQLELWGANTLGREISIRVNQGVGSGHHKHTITGGPESKFGISPADFAKARKIAQRYGLRITGIHQHIGSGILDEKTFMQGVEALLTVSAEFPDVTHLDFGGGLGIPYAPHQRAWDLQKLGKTFRARLARFEQKTGRSYAYSLEPGRYIVAQSGTLLVEVVDEKRTSEHRFIGVNSGMNQLIRPAMYDAYHEIENLTSRTGKKERVSVVGNICESSDMFARHRLMALPKIGDVLAIRDAGAYGRSMASRYNQRELPREYLLTSTGKIKDITQAL